MKSMHLPSHYSHANDPAGIHLTPPADRARAIPVVKGGQVGSVIYWY